MFLGTIEASESQVLKLPALPSVVCLLSLRSLSRMRSGCGSDSLPERWSGHFWNSGASKVLTEVAMYLASEAANEVGEGVSG